MQVLNVLSLLNNFNTENSNTMILQFFFQGKTQELIKIFSKASHRINQGLLIYCSDSTYHLHQNIRKGLNNEEFFFLFDCFFLFSCSGKNKVPPEIIQAKRNAGYIMGCIKGPGALQQKWRIKILQ